jgi:hypothetical protein
VIPLFAEKHKRKLAAILSADAAGYNRLMGKTVVQWNAG